MSNIPNEIGRFSLGGIKSYKGHEGETCLQGNLLINGKKVGEWSEDAWGGPMRIHLETSDLEKELHEAANKHQVAIDFAKEMLEEYKVETIVGNNTDLVISTIAQEVFGAKQEEAQLKRWCKAKTVIKVAGAKPDEYLIFKMVYNAACDERLLQKYPGCEIINKRFL